MRNKIVTCIGLSLFVTAGCGGDDGPSCGEGTMLVDGACVAACGTGTTLQDGVCVADAPTTCGPGTVLQGTTCVLDTTAPSPVTGLAAAISGSNINLSWTAGASSASTLVVRLKAGAADAPEPGKAYTVGQTLPGGSTVISVGSATTASDAFTTPGRYAYMAWPINATGSYGFGREVAIVTSIPAQMATLTVSATAATVTAQPANFQLAVTNFVYDADNSRATFDLAVTNNTAGHVFNTKAIVKSASTGVITSDGTTGANEPIVQLAFAALEPAGSRSRSVEITNLAASDTSTIEVQIAESGFGIFGAEAIDVGGSQSTTLDLPVTNGNQVDKSIFTSGFFSASGRYFYGGTRWSTDIFRLDLTTGDTASVSPVGTSAASLACLVRGDDGYAYAAYGIGGHRQRGGNVIGIAKLDPGSLTVLATAKVVLDGDGQTVGCALKGTKLAISHAANVFFANLDTMAFIDTDTTSSEIDPVVLGGQTIRALAFSPNGATLYAAATKSDLTIHAIDTTAFTSSAYHTATTRVMSLTVDATGKLWWGADDGIYSFDGTTETKVPNFSDKVKAIASVAGNTALVGGNETFAIDLTTGERTNVADVGTNDRTGHTMVVYPVP
ncbi:MAG: hypothetical protein SFX73_13025 [Kofleriaceae bacterium]|nr:hypothetical protein [Kofleriaceae bacterium]